MQTQLKKIKLKGKFPINLFIDENKLPISTQELTDLLTEGKPITFTGQRTPIYKLSNGLYLRAKGFYYRKNNYEEIKTYTLNEHEFLTTEKTKKLGLRMAKYKRPFPKRFKENSAHFYKHIPQTDGTFQKELTKPRPYAAMTLDRALKEYHSNKWAREEGLPVDLPIGYAEFPNLNFKHMGNNIPCGGFLAIIPTPLDLRLTEILYHLPQVPEIQTAYDLPSKETHHLLLYALHSMGSMLSKFHAKKRTLTYFHPMNIKIGIVDDDMNPKFKDENGLPLISVCDLDGVEYRTNKSKTVHLANMAFDFTGLMLIPDAFLDTQFTPDMIAALKKDDDQKWMCNITLRMRDQTQIERPSSLAAYYAMAGYFGIDPTNKIMPLLTNIIFENHYKHGGRIQDLKEDVFLYLLKEKNNMNLRGHPKWIGEFLKENIIHVSY